MKVLQKGQRAPSLVLGQYCNKTGVDPQTWKDLQSAARSWDSNYVV